MLIKDPPIWTKEAAATIRDFLSTPVGQVALAHVAARRPPLLRTGTVEQVALAGAAASGFELAISAFVSLAEPPAKEVVEKHQDGYPSLDNDAEWNDGQSLKDPKTPQQQK